MSYNGHMLLLCYVYEYANKVNQKNCSNCKNGHPHKVETTISDTKALRTLGFSLSTQVESQQNNNRATLL